MPFTSLTRLGVRSPSEAPDLVIFPVWGGEEYALQMPVGGTIATGSASEMLDALVAHVRVADD